MPKQPQWQPLSNLSLFAHHIDSTLATVQDHSQTLLSAKGKPHVLDDSMIKQIKAFFPAQQQDLWLLDVQLIQWLSGKLTQEQYMEIERLTGQMAKLQEQITALLALADDLEKDTIENVLARRDAALGLAFLLNSEPFGRNR